MPVYAYRCETCERNQDSYNRIDERHTNAPVCCDQPMGIRLTPAYIRPDIEPYESIIDGSEITGRAAHREHLKETGCVELGDEKPQWMKDKEEADANGIAWKPPPKEVDDTGISFDWEECNA